MYNISNLIKATKQYSINPNTADEIYVNDLLSPLVEVGHIRLRNNEEYYLSKPRVSDLVNGKIDVPSALRSAAERLDVEEKLTKQYQEQLPVLFSSDSICAVVKEVTVLVSKAGNLSDDEKETIISSGSNPARFFSRALLKSISVSNTRNTPKRMVYSHGVNTVDIIVGDIFAYCSKKKANNNNIIVIPVNNTFDTVVSRKYDNKEIPLIAASTLHGQFLERWTKGGNEINQLDDRISNVIHARDYMPLCIRAGADNSKQTGYPIGTVVPVVWNNVTIYLLAVSQFDDMNTAHSSKEYIETALISLLEFYNVFGQGNDIYIPLVGTGRSRANLSNKEAVDLFEKVINENQEKLHGKIHMVVTPNIGEELLVM